MIEDAGFEFATEWLMANPNEDSYNRRNVRELAQSDFKKAIFDCCYEKGGRDLVDYVFHRDANKLGRTPGGTKSIMQTAYSTILTDPRLQRVVGNLVEFLNPVIANMPKKDGSAHQAQVRRRTALTTPGVWVIDTDTATEDTGTYANVTFNYRTALSQGQFSRFMLAVGRSIGGILAEELMYKTEEFTDYIEAAIVRGSNTTTPKGPDGLDILIPAAQVVAMTAGTGGAALTKAKMDLAVDTCTGAGADFIFASKRGRRDINVLEESYRRYNMDNKVTVAGGMRVNSWDGIPILPTSNILNTMQFNNTTLSSYTGGSETELIFLNTTECWLEFLTPITVMPLARDTSQHVKFDIFTDMVIVMRNYQRHCRLTGIISA